jgi:hypothetical protein
VFRERHGFAFTLSWEVVMSIMHVPVNDWMFALDSRGLADIFLRNRCTVHVKSPRLKLALAYDMHWSGGSGGLLPTPPSTLDAWESKPPRHWPVWDGSIFWSPYGLAAGGPFQKPSPVSALELFSFPAWVQFGGLSKYMPGSIPFYLMLGRKTLVAWQQCYTRNSSLRSSFVRDHVLHSLLTGSVASPRQEKGSFSLGFSGRSAMAAVR